MCGVKQLRFCSSILLLILISAHPNVSAQEEEVEGETYIDTADQIPQDGQWTFQCALGYAREPSEFNCQSGPVDMPTQDLRGEIGFWTKCGSRCLITYNVQQGDISFEAKLYQRNLLTEVQVNDEMWEYVQGSGWITFTKPLTGIRKIALRLEHFSKDDFTLLDSLTVQHTT